MEQTNKVRLTFFSSGYCESHANIVNPRSGKGKCNFYAVWALIHCPENGYILFDTGYSQYFNKATDSFPDRFYRWATPMFLNDGESAKEILNKKGITASEVKYIIVSHFHADHIGGLLDFPAATIICSKEAYNEAVTLKGIRAVSKGVLSKLLPSIKNTQIQFIEEIASTRNINEAGIIEYSLLNIKELKIISLPGHAKAMLGFIYKNKHSHILYATDASWSYDTYKNKILPKKIVKLFFDSWSDFIGTQEKLRHYEKNNEHVKIIFTHCPETLNYLNYAF